MNDETTEYIRRYTAYLTERIQAMEKATKERYGEVPVWDPLKQEYAWITPYRRRQLT